MKNAKKNKLTKLFLLISAGVLGSASVGAMAQEAKTEGVASESPVNDVSEKKSLSSVLFFRANAEIKAKPVMFHIKGTNSIVVDLIGVDRDLKDYKNFKDDLIKQIKVKIVEGRARIVIDTNKPVLFKNDVFGKMVKLELLEADEFGLMDYTEVKAEPVAVKEESKVEVKVEPVAVKEEPKVEVKVEPVAVKEEPKIEVKVEPVAVKEEPKVEVKVEPVAVKEEPKVEVKVEPVAVKEEPKVEIKAEPVVLKNLANKPVPDSLVTKVVVEPKLIAKPTVKATIGAVFTEIEKINFKNMGSRTGKLTIDLSDKSINPNVSRQGNKLFIDFEGVSIPNELQTRMKVDHLTTVSQSIDVSMQKNNGRVILEQADGWDYSFYQMEKTFVVEVKPVTEKIEKPKHVGKPLSINFQNMDVRAVLQVIADFTGLNIMSSDSVAGSMTIRLKDVPWDQALDLVLESRNLQKVKEGNVIWIATRQEVAENNKARLELKNQSESLDPLKLEFFQVNHYKAEELKNVLEGKMDSSSTSGSVRLLSKRGSIGVDVRNNVLFIQDTESNLAELRKLVARLDIPTRQVLIEAKIVIADNKFSKEIGTKFGIRARGNIDTTRIGIGGTLTQSGDLAAGLTNAVNPVSALAAVGANAVSPGVIGITLLSAGGNALGVELSALEQNNRGKVVSNPRLLTTDNKTAVIEQGTEVPYVTPGSANAPPTVSFKKAVLSLGVTPQIAPNGKVVMNLKIRKDSIGELINIQGGGQIPSIDTKNINTEVTVNNGQTVVLGGVYEISNKKDISKIPFFGDLPIIGNLFKHTNNIEDKGELLIFITPFVVDSVDLDSDSPSAVKEVEFRKK